MYRLLEESFREEPFVTFGLAVFACYLALIAINIAYLYYVYYFPSFCFYALLALVAFISFSSCCNSLRTFIVGQCLSLGPFSVSPLPPCPDFAFVAPRHVEVSRLRRVLCEPPVMGKNREEEKPAISYFNWNNNAVRRRDKGSLPFRHILDSDPIDVLGVDVEVYSWADIMRRINDFYRRQNDDRKKSHSKNTSPTVLPDPVDLLCEQFAAMDLGPSAQASASVQHQDEPASPMLVDVICDDVVQSWEDEADADSLALTNTFSSSSAGTPFPDCDVEMEDSFENDSNEIPSAAAGEIGPAAMDIDGDSVSMDNRVQEQEQQQEQQESSVGFDATDAMDTAAELAFMSPAQEQSIPDGHTPVVGTVDDSDDFSPEVIADTAAVEASEHAQDVGDSTASIDALALAILANMLPPLEQSNITTDGFACLADVSSDFPAMTNAATLVEESNGEEVRVGVDELVEREAPSAMQTAAELAFMPPAQEQSMPEEYTPVFSADDYSDIIAAAVAVENSEHVQDVGDSTALYNALALAMAANMLPSLDLSNITTDGYASLVDVSSDFPTIANAASLVEVFNDEEVRVGVDELAEGDASVQIPAYEEDRVGVDGPMNDVEDSSLPPPQATRSPVEDIFSEFLVEYDDGDYEYWG
ncbi:hypothetical protein INT45_009469 [Circinella minor]|uniref:Uncharacterized protein n=1 Tax=Circinella minor TaxID=1195481 RepID=A0A8H7RUH1_9FUNG|nr:hypothetical protein INT45_009469 [Circinella minor]